MSNQNQPDGEPESRPSTLLNRLLPFSPSLLRSLPKTNRPTRYTRADAIPQTETNDDGLQPTVQDYHAISGNGAANVRVPKKIATPVRVEGKVWFANERNNVAGPLIIAALLFIAVLANFIIRVRELKQKNVPIPGTDFVQSFFSKTDPPFGGVNVTGSQRAPAFGWA
ncbi:hypothetical protein HWV62_41717 [Athelia sp. TMB]|nr:hypothetical protein HWV62_41717 [Athelia sp. TMB]